jgi:hypothetical protein
MTPADMQCAILVTLTHKRPQHWPYQRRHEQDANGQTSPVRVEDISYRPNASTPARWWKNSVRM